jgi:LPXTG-motif cell wall-anchored protein
MTNTVAMRDVVISVELDNPVMWLSISAILAIASVAFLLVRQRKRKAN